MKVYATDDSSASRVAGRVLCRLTTAYKVGLAVGCPFGDSDMPSGYPEHEPSFSLATTGRLRVRKTRI
eukprot:332753-Rhodomonas_salina.1